MAESFEARLPVMGATWCANCYPIYSHCARSALLPVCNEISENAEGAERMDLITQGISYKTRNAGKPKTVRALTTRPKPIFERIYLYNEKRPAKDDQATAKQNLVLNIGTACLRHRRLFFFKETFYIVRYFYFFLFLFCTCMLRITMLL